MVDARWVRVVLVGERTGTSFPGEIWQTGFSMCDEDDGGIFTGAAKAALPVFAASSIGNTETDGNYVIDWAWEGTSKFTKANQKAIVGHWMTAWNSLRNYVTADSQLHEIRISAYGTDRHVINGANVFTFTTPNAGAVNSTGQLPAQLAVVASMRTAARGASGRGRMFLPLNGITDSGGKIPSAAYNAAGNAIKTLCENVRAVGPLVSVVNPTPLTYSDVSNIQVGQYFDVQRRRENATDETYTSYTPTLS